MPRPPRQAIGPILERAGQLMAKGLLLIAIAGCGPRGFLPQLEAGTVGQVQQLLGGSKPAPAAGPVAAIHAGTLVPPIVGQVTFPPAMQTQAIGFRKVQACIGCGGASDVANASTVSLIDTGSDTTVATTVTNSSGGFSLSLPGWSPTAGAIYYLEAMKGLGNNHAGHSAARVRTLISFVGGNWQSITAGTITINSGSTALSVGADLFNVADGGAFNYAKLLGSISGSTYTPPTGLAQYDYLTQADFGTTTGTTTLLGLVTTALAADEDPVGTIGLTLPDTWVQVNTPGGSTLSVTSLSPAIGTIGTAVTVTGTGFSTTAASDSVTFKWASAVNPASAASTSFSVTVPPGSLTGATLIQAGNSLVWGPSFSVVPTITSFSPGSAVTGTNIPITGTGFDPTAANDTVVFSGGATASVVAATTTQLTATVPAGALFGPITVMTAGGSATSASSFTVQPTLSSLLPASGLIGSSITLTGTGFGTSQGSSTVTFNGTAAITIPSWSTSSITVTVPAGATNGNVVVTTSGGTSLGVAFNVVPQISSLSAPSGITGTNITISGTGFGTSTGSVTVNGSLATVGIWNDTSIGITIPAAATTGNVVVTGSNGLASAGSLFTVIPNITSLSPTLGLAGTAVTIAGTGFGTSQGTSTVTFNGTAATVTSGNWSDTSISTTVPSGATTGNVVVTVGGNASGGVVFTVAPAGFVPIPSGSFTMGAPSSELGYASDEAQYSVTLTHSFFMDTTDVTQSQWSSMAAQYPASFSATNPSYFSGNPNNPVERVDWWDALSYANGMSASASLPACYTMSGCSGTAGAQNLSCTGVTINSTDGTPYTCTGYRLSTESEWEYAYRAGSTTAYYNSVTNTSTTNDPNLNPLAWYYYNDGTTTEPVGGKTANSWGLYDMAGNVWQWVWDWYGTYPSGSITNPTGAPSGPYRMHRGGGFSGGASFERAADRGSDTPTTIRSFIGFRLVRSAN